MVLLFNSAAERDEAATILDDEFIDCSVEVSSTPGRFALNVSDPDDREDVEDYLDDAEISHRWEFESEDDSDEDDDDEDGFFNDDDEDDEEDDDWDR